MLVICQSTSATDYLFLNGKSDYSIVIQDDASVSEHTAAKDFQSVIRQISGVTLPIVTRSARKGIYIGWTPQTGVPQPKNTDESFTHKTIGNSLYIFGGCKRGTMYGVFRFLERELGVHWYTSSFTKITKRKNYALPSLSHSEKPVIRQRLDFYYDALRHHDWVAHNLLNTQYLLANTPYGNMSSYWGIHTFEKLIPPSKYFRTHPEYFSVYKGRRSDKAQLCLSNTSMLRELTKNLLEAIAKNPGYWCYDVSQNDNPWPCECPACQRLTKKYGGHSGAMIWFVNQVANQVKQIYPDIYIGTFAYKYTRQAPKSDIKPAGNVVVRLCDIECCMAHPLETCEKNRDFLSDMNDWRKITKNIYIWDYTTGFRHYLLPFPNFTVLAANFRYFSKSSVIGILEEGVHNVPWGEFSELKQWLIAKLMWNPYQNTDSLATQFINDYYGKAAPYIKRYYDLCQRQVSDSNHFSVKLDYNADIFSKRFIDEGMVLIQRALTAVANNSTELKRTQRIAAQLYYLKLRRNTTTSTIDGTIKQLQNIIKDDHTTIDEQGTTIDEFLKIHKL